MLTRSEGLGKLTSNRNYDNLSGTSIHGGSSALNGTGTIIIQGTLTKKGRGSLYFPWSSRFVTLDDNGYLRYYKHAPQILSYQSTVSEQETNLRGIVNLRGCTVRVLSSKERHKHPFAFILENLPSQYATQSSTLTLAANSAFEMHGWVSLIQTLTAKLAVQADENSKYRYETLDVSLDAVSFQSLLCINKLFICLGINRIYWESPDSFRALPSVDQLSCIRAPQSLNSAN